MNVSLPPTCQIIHHTKALLNTHAHTTITRGYSPAHVAMDLFFWKFFKSSVWGLRLISPLYACYFKRLFYGVENKTTHQSTNTTFFPKNFPELEGCVQTNNDSDWVLCVKDNSPQSFNSGYWRQTHHAIGQVRGVYVISRVFLLAYIVKLTQGLLISEEMRIKRRKGVSLPSL